MGKQGHFKPEGRVGDPAALLAGMVAAATLTILTWGIVLLNGPTSMGWFAFHPLLQSLSLALFTYGILTLQPTSQPKTKAAGLSRHQIVMLLLGLPCIALGTLAVMFNKWLNGKPHFMSWHGTLGIVAIVWLLFQILLGGGSVWNNGAAFGGGAKAKVVWKYHRLSGYILFTLLLYSVHLGGGRSFWGEKYSGKGIRFFAYTLAPFVVVVSVYSRVRPSKMRFI